MGEWLNERFNGTLSNELLNREIFYTLKEAKVLIERWRVQYNTVRPHSSLGYKPPAPEAVLVRYDGRMERQGTHRGRGSAAPFAALTPPQILGGSNVQSLTLSVV